MQEKPESSSERMGLTPDKVGSRLEKGSENMYTRLAEKFKSSLTEQIFEFRDDKNVQTWIGRFKNISSKTKDELRGRGEILLGGILATSRARSATDSFMGGRRAEGAMFTLLAAVSMGLIIRKGWNRKGNRLEVAF